MLSAGFINHNVLFFEIILKASFSNIASFSYQDRNFYFFYLTFVSEVDCSIKNQNF